MIDRDFYFRPLEGFHQEKRKKAGEREEKTSARVSQCLAKCRCAIREEWGIDLLLLLPSRAYWFPKVDGEVNWQIVLFVFVYFAV